MADIDVSDLLNDPDFADVVTVIRRSQTIGANGRSENYGQYFDDVAMCISPTGRNEIERLDDSQKQLRSIKAITSFRLQGPTVGQGSDIVMWQDSAYLVAVVDPYTQFGAGFVEAILVSTNIQEVTFE